LCDQGTHSNTINYDYNNQLSTTTHSKQLEEEFPLSVGEEAKMATQEQQDEQRSHPLRRRRRALHHEEAELDKNQNAKPSRQSRSRLCRPGEEHDDNDEGSSIFTSIVKTVIPEKTNNKKKKATDDDDDTVMGLIMAGIIFVSVLISITGLYVLVLLYNRYSSTMTTRISTVGDVFPVLPSSPIYTVPYSLGHIGDRSDEYATLRRDHDASYPLDDYRRSLATARSLRHPIYDALRPPVGLPYDVHDCPYDPPPDYPHEYPTVQLLQHWPSNRRFPNDVPNDDAAAVGGTAHLAICVFDYGRDYTKALNYRRHELPFVVRNDPRVAETVERWSNQTFLTALFHTVGSRRGGAVYHRAEQSHNLEFLYWRPDVVMKTEAEDGDADGRPAFNKMSWTQPTKLIQISYREWHAKALEVERRNREADGATFRSDVGPYYYFRLIGCGETSPTGDCDNVGGTSEYLFDELPFLQPTSGGLYVASPENQRGVHCRFGVDGVQAQNHFDSSRNVIVMLGGQRRYVLSHPRSCVHQALYPPGHPSARHSQVNWTDVGLSTDDDGGGWEVLHPQFVNSTSNEVVLQGGDALYLPTNWFHYIVSLSINYQCNTRSGRTAHYDPFIERCGFQKTSTDGAKKHGKERGTLQKN
jgi:hypothetical protein